MQFAQQQRIGVKLVSKRKTPNPEKQPTTAGRFFHNVTAMVTLQKLPLYAPFISIIVLCAEPEEVFRTTLSDLIASHGASSGMPFSQAKSSMKGAVVVPKTDEKGDVFFTDCNSGLLRVGWDERPNQSVELLVHDEWTEKGVVVFLNGDGARKWTVTFHSKIKPTALETAFASAEASQSPNTPSSVVVSHLVPTSLKSICMKVSDVIPLQTQT